MDITEQIKELYRQQESGEITEEECTARSLVLAKQLAGAVKGKEFFVKMLDFVEANPKVVRAVVVGMCAGVRNYLED